MSWSPYKFTFSRHVNRPWVGSFANIQSSDFTLLRKDSLEKLWQHPLIHLFYIWSMPKIKSNTFIIYVTFHTRVCIYINLYTHCTYSNIFTMFLRTCSWKYYFVWTQAAKYTCQTVITLSIFLLPLILSYNTTASMYTHLYRVNFPKLPIFIPLFPTLCLSQMQAMTPLWVPLNNLLLSLHAAKEKEEPEIRANSRKAKHWCQPPGTGSE